MTTVNIWRAAAFMLNAKPTPPARKGHIVITLLLMLLTTASAWANEPVKYIDENGQEQEVTEYTVLTGSEAPDSNGEIQLAEGTYVVNSSNLTYQHTISLLSNTTLILADGANMTVEPVEEGFGI